MPTFKSILALLPAALLLCVSAAAAEDTCYYRELNQIRPGDVREYFACNNTETTPGGAQLCCKTGSRCGPDSICRATGEGDFGSQWYVGGCTDKTYNDPICRKNCTMDKQTWIEYSDQKDEWSCCGDYGCNAANGTDSFKAVSLAVWEPIPQANNGKSGNNSSSDDSGMSKDTKIEIGAGVGVGIVVLLALAGGFFFWRMRRSRKHKQQNFNLPVPMGKYREINPQQGPSGTNSSYERGYDPAPGSTEYQGSSQQHGDQAPMLPSAQLSPYGGDREASMSAERLVPHKSADDEGA